MKNPNYSNDHKCILNLIQEAKFVGISTLHCNLHYDKPMKKKSRGKLALIH